MHKIEHRIIVLFCCIAIFYWMMDAVFDYYFALLPNRTFGSILLYDAPTHPRTYTSIFFIALGFYISKLVNKNRMVMHSYQQLFDNQDDLIFAFPLNASEWQANFIEVNAAACRKLGYSKAELLQLSPFKVTAPERVSEIPSLWERFQADNHILFEITLKGKNGLEFPVEIKAHKVILEDKPSVLAIARDITVRQRREEEIQRLASFPQLNPAPILEVDAAGKITFCNPAALETLKKQGVEGPEAFLPENLNDILRAAKESGITQFYREIAIKEALYGEFIYFTPQYEAIRLYPVDITEQRRADNALRDSERQLRLLTSQLLNVQEDERRRISAELHDELGQAMMLLKLKIHAIQDGLRQNQETLREECGYSLHYLDGIIENVRRLSRDLSPRSLEALGLLSATRLWLEEFSKHYEVQDLSLDLDEIDDLFSPRAQLNIYRVFQECLTNIGRHAQASKISLAVKREQDRVVFKIRDDGKGFDVKQALARESSMKGIGLATMAERVRMLGGTLEIRSETGSGTQITFAIPIDGRGEPEDGPIPNRVG